MTSVVCVRRTTQMQMTIAQYEPTSTPYTEDVPLFTYGGLPTQGALGGPAPWPVDFERLDPQFGKIVEESRWLGSAETLSKHDTSLKKTDFKSDVSKAISSGAAIIAQPSLGTGADAALRSMHAILKSEKHEAQADLSAIFTRCHFVNLQVLDCRNVALELKMSDPRFWLRFDRGHG